LALAHQWTERVIGDRKPSRRDFRDLPGIAHTAGYRFTAEETSRILGRNAQAFYGLELEPLVHATAEQPNRS
jgi:hypothetical protein